jgi:hypothetical protein
MLSRVSMEAVLVFETAMPFYGCDLSDEVLLESATKNTQHLIRDHTLLQYWSIKIHSCAWNRAESRDSRRCVVSL